MTSIDELEGRELDAAVHEALFGPVVGWAEVVRYPTGSTVNELDGDEKGEPVYVDGCVCEHFDADDGVLLPHEKIKIHGHYRFCLAPVPLYGYDNAREWPARLHIRRAGRR